MGTWNIQRLLEDDQLPLLSYELRGLNVIIAGLSETRRPGSGSVSSGEYTYYWSGMRDGNHKGVAIAVSNQLKPFIVEVAPIDEQIMKMRVRHTLGFISLIVVYAPIEESETVEKEMFYIKLNSVLDRCPPRDIHVVLGNFNATTGTSRAGYEHCLGPHGSGPRNCNGSFLLSFAQSRRLRIAGSFFMRRIPYRYTWYSNGDQEGKEVDHILTNTRWRIVHNCRVFRSAKFFETEHRLVIATLKIHVKSKSKDSSQVEIKGEEV